MTKRDKIELLMLLSALETWAFAHGKRPPEWLVEAINTKVEILTEEVLDD